MLHVTTYMHIRTILFVSGVFVVYVFLRVTVSH